MRNACIVGMFVVRLNVMWVNSNNPNGVDMAVLGMYRSSMGN